MLNGARAGQRVFRCVTSSEPKHRVVFASPDSAGLPLAWRDRNLQADVRHEALRM